MERQSLRLSLPLDLVSRLKTRATQLGIPLSHLVSQLCAQGLEQQDYDQRLRRLETQIAQLQERLTPAPPPPPTPTLDWDPLTHDFDSWLLHVWSHFATDQQTGQIRWGSPVSADQIHAAGFRILRKQAFLDRLANSEAPGLQATSWDPEHPDLALINCRIQTVIFANPATQPDER